MGKNIVICADGTGNKGGSGSDTNVFKLYNAIKGKPDGREQVTFYDNGVGTSAHVVYRALGGALGLGFKHNVRDLYEFVGRHYEIGDDIYGFGFSRGAATMRACVGMIKHCGLVRKIVHTGDEKQKRTILDETEFQRQIDAAMAFYAKRKGNVSLAGLWHLISPPDLKYDGYNDIKIEFLGLWDTVAALGFPQLGLFDDLVNFIRRHKFYDYEPKGIVNHLFHAVAIDDERRTFWPLIWDEHKFGEDQHVEQVWFSGMHSNVGGGYPRSGLSNVTLDWMIARLQGHENTHSDSDRGLVINANKIAEVGDGVNPYGKMYDSRDGFALMYRYQPRIIKDLCEGQLRNRTQDKISGKVKIHSAVFDRMELRTAGYGPGHLPDSFEVVNSRVKEEGAEAQLYSDVVSSWDLGNLGEVN